MTKNENKWIIALCTKTKAPYLAKCRYGAKRREKGLLQKLAACVQDVDDKSDISVPESIALFQNDQLHQVVEKCIEHREL